MLLAEHVHIIRCEKTPHAVINGDISLFFDSSYNVIMANEQGHLDIMIWKVRYFYLYILYRYEVIQGSSHEPSPSVRLDWYHSCFILYQDMLPEESNVR